MVGPLSAVVLSGSALDFSELAVAVAWCRFATNAEYQRYPPVPYAARKVRKFINFAKPAIDTCFSTPV
jgi:hypothetical protein